MKDKSRIRGVCGRLAAAWERVPELRFGQLMSNVFLAMQSEGKDPFFPEDDSMIEYIEQYIERQTQNRIV